MSKKDRPSHSHEPAGGPAHPTQPGDARWQAAIEAARLSPSASAPPLSTVQHGPGETAPAAGGHRPGSAGERAAHAPGHPTRRTFSLAIALGWTAVAAAGVVSVGMFTDFMGPKVPKEPRRHWRLGRLDEYLQPLLVSEQFKRTPDGGPGFWIVNLSPRQARLVALSVVCTHLGCIPDWMSGDQKYKCPCHGSGFSVEGFNLEGPAPRPLERFAIAVDPEGRVVVDQTRVFRQELGEWDHPDSFIVV